MESLTRFLLRQGVLLNVLFFGVVILSALFAVPNIPIDRYPNIQFGEVQITTRYPGASPEEVERLVTDIIEESIRGMTDIDFIRSVSHANQSLIRVKFVDDTDYASLYDELRLRVLGVQSRLPTVNGDPLTPYFEEQDVDEWLPVIQFNLVAADPNIPLPKRALVLLAKDLRTRLQTLPDVKDVLLLGDDPEQFVVALDPRALERHRITTTEVVAALRSTGTAPPAGTLDTALGERLIRVDHRFRDREDLQSVVVRRDGDGNLLRVADLLDAEATGFRRIDGSAISTVNGRETVTCKVLKTQSGNAIDIKRDALAVVDEFLETHGDAKVAVVPTLDSTFKIKDGLGVLVNNLLLSVVLVMALLFLFMAQRGRRLTLFGLGLGVVAAVVVGAVQVTWVQSVTIGLLTLFVFATCRAAVLTVSGIVFAFLGSLLVFYFAGQSVNEISLLGFVLVIGIVVDDAIVVIENIQRRREEGDGLIDSVVRGTSEVFWPVTSATLTTMAAFLPMLIMTGSTGDFFALVPIAVCVALAISLVECLVMLPLHVVDLERLMGPDRSAELGRASQGDPLRRPGFLGRVSRGYDRLLRFNLTHPATALGGSLLLFVLAVFLLFAPAFGLRPVLKLVFFPEDTSVALVFVRMPPGTPLSETDAKVRAISERLVERGPGEVRSVSGTAGFLVDLAYRPVWSNQYGILFTEMAPRADRTYDDPAALIARIRNDLEAEFERDGVDLEIMAAQDGPPVGQPLNVRVTGVDDSTVLAMAEELHEWLHQAAGPNGPLDGLIDVTHDRTQVSTVVSFEPDRERVSLFGLRDVGVQQFVADALDGAYVGDFRRVDEDVPVRVRLSPDAIGDPLDLLDVPITNDVDGRLVRFSDVGRVALSQEPASLVRRDFERAITITGNLAADAELGTTEVTREIRRWYRDRAPDYPGVALAFGGEAESTGKSYRSLILAFGIATLLIYAILASQFRSYAQPFLIMSNIMFSFTGVILAMAFFSVAAELMPAGWVRPERSYFTVQAFIAIVGLTGLVINDAIVLINFMNRRVADGLPLRDAVLTAGHQRMRPILMTTATTIAGLLPMAIGIPDFSIAWSPFATCFIAGLIVSTSMTLLVVPVLYQLLESVRHRIGNRIARRHARQGGDSLASAAPSTLAGVLIALAGIGVATSVAHAGPPAPEQTRPTAISIAVEKSENGEVPAEIVLDGDAADALARLRVESVEAAREALEAQRSLNRADRAFSYPRIGASATYTYNGDLPEIDFGPFGDFEAGRENDYRLDLSGEQLIYAFGRREAVRERSRALVDSSRAELSRARLEAGMRARTALADVWLSEADLVIARERLSQRHDELEDARDLFEVGKVAEIDVREASIRLIQSEDSLRSVQARADRARLALAAAVAAEPEEIRVAGTLERPGDLGARISAARDRIEGGVEIRSLRAQRDVEDATRRDLGAQQRPEILGFGALGADGDKPDDLDSSWNVGVAIQWSLYDGGSRIAQQSAAKHRAREIGQRIEDVRRGRRTALAQLVSDLRYLDERITRQREAVTLAESNYEDAREQYRAGLITITRLGDVSLDVAEARFRLAALVHREVLTSIELRRLAE